MLLPNTEITILCYVFLSFSIPNNNSVTYVEEEVRWRRQKQKLLN